MIALPSAKAKLYPNAYQTIVITAVSVMHCISTDSTFFVRTNPP